MKCEFCRAPFTPHKHGQRFCTPKCQQGNRTRTDGKYGEVNAEESFAARLKGRRFG